MSDTNTARDALEAAIDAACPTEEGRRLVDAYRDEVLTKGAVQQREAAEALPDGDPLIPGLLYAADLLLTARTTTAPTSQEQL